MLICNSIDFIEKLANLDVLKVNLSDGTSPYWFYDYNRSLEFVGKEVIVSTRNDMYHGNMVDVINTFVMPSKVNTIERHENIKLFCDGEDNFSNLSFNEIQEGETKPSCLFYCVAQAPKSSAQSTWVEYIVRDRTLRTMKLRVFDSDNPNAELAGHYCMASLTRSKYGLQTRMIAPANGECPRNPEIDIAKEFVTHYFEADAVAMTFMRDLNFIAKMESVVDYEAGYGLVRLAMELSMCEQLYNVTNSIDVKLVEHALLASYANNCSDLPFSDELRNVVLAMRAKWPNSAKLVAMIDPGTVEARPGEYEIYLGIRNMVNAILEEKKSYK